jgi:hypothetical protein
MGTGGAHRSPWQGAGVRAVRLRGVAEDPALETSTGEKGKG